MTFDTKGAPRLRLFALGDVISYIIITKGRSVFLVVTVFRYKIYSYNKYLN